MNPNINFTNFTSGTDLQINGNASLISNALRLTPDVSNQRGSAYYKQAFTLDQATSFSTQFQFRTGGTQGTNGADGLAFVIQGNGATALGATGGNLGYGGVNNSLAVKFDTYKSDEYADISNNSIGILKNGNMQATTQTNVGIDLNSGSAVNAWVDYSATTRRMDVYLSTTATKPGTATLSESIDLTALVGGTAYMGFSGATGGLRNSQSIENWTASSRQDTIVPPVGAGTGTGLKGEYFDNINFTNSKFTRTDKDVNFNWGAGSPDARIANDTFSVRWTGQVQPLYTEEYTFSTTTDDGAKLVIDGRTVVDSLINQGATERTGKITLEKDKKYNLQFDYFENTGLASSQLSWVSNSQVKQIVPTAQLYPDGGGPVEPPPGAGNGDGLRGEYFDNIDFTNSKFSRVDKDVNFNWGAGSPDARIGNDTFSARWTGQIQPLYTEDYTFTTTTDDGSKLIIDGTTVVDALFNQAATDRSGRITLQKGQKYNIQLDYFENSGLASSQLSWASASQARQIVPTSQLYSVGAPPVLGLPTITLGTPTATVTESAGTVAMRIDRTATNAADLNVTSTVQYITNNASAIAGQDYTATTATATFAPGETTKTILIPILNDTIAEPTETFGFGLGAVTNASLGVARTATITILDDDAAATLEFSRADYPIGEAAGTVTVTVNRGGDSSGISTVKYATSVGTASLLDYTETSGTLTFAAGATSQTFAVPITNDTIVESDEIFNLTLTEAVGATLARDKATVTISDNDSVGNFVREDFISGNGANGQSKLFLPIAFEWAAPDTVFIAEKGGVIKVAKNGVLQANPFLDFSQQINDNGDRGLLDITLHPDFANGKPFVYLYYVFDPTEAPSRDQGLNRNARLTRVRAQQDAAGNWSAVPNSEEIIVGKNSTWANISRPDLDSTATITFDPNAAGYTGLIPASGVTVAADGTRTNLKDYIAVDSLSHAGGTILFDSNKNLYLTIGDGTSYNGTDPRTQRVLDTGNLSGKVLKMTDTGAGLSDNPFWTGDPTDNASKVYAYGFRNPFRANFGPNDQLAVADVGWYTYEEVNLVTKGYNAGWPAYEGGQGTPIRAPGHQDLPFTQAYYATGAVTQGAAYAYLHNGSNALLSGAYYTGNTFPAIWKDTLFVTDVSQGWVEALKFNPDRTLASARRFDEDESLKFITNMAVGPDGNMYFVDLDNSKIGRWRSVASSTPGNTNQVRSEPTQRIIKDGTSGSTFLNFK